MVSWPDLGTRVTVRYRRPSASVPPLPAALGHPLAVDPSGVLYIADFDNNLVRRVGTDGAISTFAGRGSATEALLVSMPRIRAWA